MENTKKEHDVNDTLTNSEHNIVLNRSQFDYLISEIRSIKEIVSVQDNDKLRIDILSGRVDNISEVCFKTLDEILILKSSLGPLTGVFNVFKKIIFFFQRR